MPLDSLPAVTFPILRSIDDVLPAIKGREEFIVSKKDGYTVVDYVFQAPDTFGCLATAMGEDLTRALIRRELRGIKFDASGRLLARPYHKFFNLNEREETLAHRIDWSRPHRVLEKLDGSMVHPAMLRGNLVFMTMLGTTDIAKQAFAFAMEHPSIDYRGFCHELLELNLLPIFEWCSRANRVVIDYPQPMLVLTGVRARTSGRYATYQAMLDHAAPFRVPVVNSWDTSIVDIDAFIEHTRALKNCEGYVVAFEDGTRIKLKADEYARIHRAKERLLREKDVVALIAQGKDDDVIGNLPDEDAAAIRDFAAALRSGIAEKARGLKADVEDASRRVGGDRKRFAVEYASKLDPRIKGISFAVFDGANPVDQILAMILANTSSSTRIEGVRSLWGGAKWSDYWSAGDFQGDNR
jgi:RNA ligase